METLQTLQKRIVTTGKLQSIVKSMKTLSAVGIRQYEKAVASLDSYLATIEKGLQVALRDYRPPVFRQPLESAGRGVVVFGSDQGLCGRFNENLAEYVGKQIDEWGTDKSALHLLVVGVRAGARLEAAGFGIDRQFWVPGSVSGINNTIYQILSVIEQWRRQYQLTKIELFFNRHARGTTGEPYSRILLPVDNIHLQRLAGKKWEGRSLPQYAIPSPNLFSGLIRQYLFVSLFRAQAESLESEQASRLRTMQNAEKNIEEHLEEIKARYRTERQTSITTELLDLVAGFKVSAGRTNAN